MAYRRFIALLMAMILLCAVPIAAESDPWAAVEELTEDVQLTTGYFEDSDRQAEHYLTYRPGGSVLPMIWYGNTLGDKLPFDEAAAQAEALGKRVIAGTNGDYYVLYSGQPVGLVISSGVLISSDGGNPALGFLQDGSAFFGAPSLKMSLTIEGENYRLAGINKPIHSGDFFLYTADYGTETSVNTKARNLVLIPESDAELRIGAEISLQVESNYWSPGGIPLRKDRWVLCLTGDSDDWRMNALDSLEAGDHLTLRITADDPRWAECTYASGSLYKLITDGIICEGLDEIDDTRAPRTAVGVREDGSVLFYTVDGRQQQYSAGLTLTETAQRLLSLGCIEAGALDGGGSTALHAQPAGEEDSTLRNSPSLGKERNVSTYLFLVTDGPSSGEGKTLSVRSPAEALLCGSRLQLEAGICDEKGSPVTGGKIRWSASSGTIRNNGMFIAPEHGGSVEITAESGGLSGHTVLAVVESPDEIRILSQDGKRELTRLDLERGESIDLTASATWGLLNVQAEDEDYRWECSGSAGSIDHSGLFTASANGGSGTVTVSAGDTSMTIGVFVKTAYTCAEDFEKAREGSTVSLSWCVERNMDHVRFGSGSLRMDYALDEGEAVYPVTWNQQEKAQYLYIWVFGDGSANALFAELGDMRIPLGTLEYSGWKLLTLETNGLGMTGISISGTGSGTIWLDQVVVSNDPIPDLEPPQLELKLDGTSILAGINDLGDGHPETEQLRLTIDGKETQFSYDAATGTLRSEITDNGLMHRVTLLAQDRSGNYTTASAVLQGKSDSPFVDMDQHWAAAYAAYLYARGVTTGREVNGERLFDPNTLITRAEFAVLLYRMLGIKAADGIQIAFSDEQDIPEWAREAVYAVASQGLIRGEQDGDSLWFKPLEPLTRAQAAAILGRTMSAGSPYADLVYSDTEQIPEWAVRYVARLAFLGVFSGFEDGTFRPNDTLTRAQAAKLLTEMS